METRPIEFVVRGFTITQYSPKNYPDSGYCEDQKIVNRLIKRTPGRFLWWKFYYEEVIDEETVPSHVWIGLGALGFDSSGWKSKFAKYMK